MKRKLPTAKGFTLIELLISVAITSVVILVLLSLTSVVADSWRAGNDKIFTNNEARAAFNRLTEDLENAVFRTTIPNSEWMAVRYNTADFSTVGATPANPAWLVFYSTPTDRTLSAPGNVVAMSYKIFPQDPVRNPVDPASPYKLYGLYRALAGTASGQNWDSRNAAQITFDNALGADANAKGKLRPYWDTAAAGTTHTDNYYISNIFDFSFTFWITYNKSVTGAAPQKETIAIPPGKNFYVTSEGIWVDTEPDPASRITYLGGQLSSVDISMTILTRDGARLAREGEYPGGSLQSMISNPKYARTYSHKVYFFPEVSRVFR